VAPHRPGRGLAVYAAAIALSATYGAAGLVLGFLPGIDDLRPRLPFDSTALGGLALLRHDPRAAVAALWSGALLVGWIVVEVLVIRELSPLQPICAGLGLGLAAWGLAGRASLAR
jgi:hypothetical protein